VSKEYLSRHYVVRHIKESHTDTMNQGS